MEKLFEIFTKYQPLFTRGTILTLKISILATIVGLLIGLGVGIIRTIPKKTGFKGVFQRFINLLLSAYITIFRGTPMMVQAVLVYYGAPYYFNFEINNLLAAYIVVSVNTGAYMAEVVRGGIISIDNGQFEAAYASGMSHFQSMLYIIIPQTLRNILPAVGNEFVINIKDTSVLNVISVGELFFAGKTISGQTFDYFNTYFVILIIYLVLTTIITKFLRILENKLDGSKSYELKMGNQMQI